VKVRIPTPLRSYTANAANVTAQGSTLTELLTDLDRQFPGIAFRVVDEQGRLRQHMTIWLGQDRCRDMTTAIADVDEVVIMQALSGG
jgi:sulfur-carrier protein